MKRWLALAGLIIGSVLTFVQPSLGQTSFFSDRAVSTFPVGTGTSRTTAVIPIQFGQVRVCTAADIGGIFSPCPDIAAITDILGNPLTVVGGNFGQIKTDVTGRFSFGCTSGTNYLVQVAASSSNVPTLSYPVTCSFGTLPGGSLVVTNPIGNALQSINGPLSLGTNSIAAGAGTLGQVNAWRMLDGNRYALTGAGLVSAWTDCNADANCIGVDATWNLGRTMSVPSTITISGNGKAFKFAGTISPTSSTACPLFDITGASVDFGGVISGTQNLFSSNILATTGYTCTSLVRSNTNSGEKGNHFHGFRLDGHNEAGISFALLEIGKSTASTNDENNWTHVDDVAVANCGSGIKISSTNADPGGSVYLNRIISVDPTQCNIPIDLSQPSLDQVIVSNSRIVGGIHAVLVGPNTAASADRVGAISLHDSDLTIKGASAADVVLIQNAQTVNIHDNWMEVGQADTSNANIVVGTATATPLNVNIHDNRILANNLAANSILHTAGTSTHIYGNHFLTITGKAIVNTSATDLWVYGNSGTGTAGAVMASYTGCTFCQGSSNTTDPQFLIGNMWGLQAPTGTDEFSLWVTGDANPTLKFRNNGNIFVGPGGATVPGAWINSFPAAGQVNIVGTTVFQPGALLLGEGSPTNASGGAIACSQNASHLTKCNSNNTNFHTALTITEFGQCAMSAGTTCTWTAGAAFSSTPFCFVNPTTSPATAVSGSCAISGTTVTVTAGASNSLTWNAVLIGNPN